MEADFLAKVVKEGRLQCRIELELSEGEVSEVFNLGKIGAEGHVT